jgi:hypothetical protein
MAIAPVPAAPIRADQRAASDQTAAGAVRDLYAACHLPSPEIVVARDAVHFARLVGRFQRRPGAESSQGMLLLFSAILAALAAVGFVARRGSGAISVFLVIAMTPMMRAGWRTDQGATAGLVRWCIRQAAGLALVGIALTGILWLRGASALQALDAAGPTLAVCGVILLLADGLRPVWARPTFSRARRGAWPEGGDLAHPARGATNRIRAASASRAGADGIPFSRACLPGGGIGRAARPDTRCD